MAPANIYGTVTAWTSGSGSIKTDDGKEIQFVQQDIAPTRCTQRPSFSITVFNNLFQCMTLPGRKTPPPVMVDVWIDC